MSLPWQEALERLKEGNARYMQDKLDGVLQESAERCRLVEGQEPFAVALTCADSRVVPEFVCGTGLGELFVVRVAGNVANTTSVGSVEYAVHYLGVNLVIVGGHQRCGAVTGAIEGGGEGPNMQHLLDQITPAIELAESTDVEEVVRANARLQAQRLIDQSEIIRRAAAERDVRVLPAYYHLESGALDFMTTV